MYTLRIRWLPGIASFSRAWSSVRTKRVNLRWNACHFGWQNDPAEP